jgi:hypothetical protein
MSRKRATVTALPDAGGDGPRPPMGLRERGLELWGRLVAEYDFSEAPEKLLLLEEAARTADLVARLQAVVDEAQELRVRGSQGQPVAMPEVTELRQYRTQLAALLRGLALPSGDEDSEGLSRSEIGRLGAAARWKNR